jgi:hypothetical protein
MSWQNENMDRYIESCEDDAIRLTDMDECCIGTNQKGYLIYCYDKMLEFYINKRGYSYEDAISHLDFNVVNISIGDRIQIRFP